MTHRKSIMGAMVLCALSLCAFTAANASALGLTAVECVETGAGSKYNTSECLTPAVTGNFSTKVVAAETKVDGTGTTAEHKTGSTASPVSIFHSTVAGVEVTVTCGKNSTTGATVTNKEEAGEMRISTTGAVVTYTECHASPRTKPTKICTVQGVTPVGALGEIKTNSLSSITGTEHKVTIKPVTGTLFTKFKINASGGECFTTAAIEVEVKGEAVGRANTETHSHLTLDEASNKLGTLTANGAAASETETIKGTKTGTAVLVGAETF